MSFDNLKEEMAENNDEILYCICKTPYTDDKFMIACDLCQEWYHGACIGIDEETSTNIDQYFCETCRKSNPELRTTFKVMYRRKRKASSSRRRQRYRNKKRSRKNKKPSLSVIPSVFGGETSFHIPSNMDDEQLAHILQMDTSKRKAKSIARKNIKRNEQYNSKTKASTQKKNHRQRIIQRILKPANKPTETITTTEKEPRQCYGPGCVNPAKQNSKYCCFECGMKLGRNRILEILPERLQQQKILPSAADELSRRKLSINRHKQKLLQIDLEQLDIRIIQTTHIIHLSKSTEVDIVVEEDGDHDENFAVDCKLCGLEVPMRTIVKHMEGCFRKHEKKIQKIVKGARPDEEEWDVYCNQRMGKQTYCRQMRVICPHHYRHCSNEDVRCGYPVRFNLSEGSGKFCGRTKKDCSIHQNQWEEIFRGQLDLEKLNILLSLSELRENEAELRREMAARGSVLGLMLHKTIVH